MKKYIPYLLILFAFSTFQTLADDTAKWGAETNGLQMAIALEDGVKEINTNQPLVLLIRYKNVSTNETFHISRANALEYDPGYSWVVISPSGKDISPDTNAKISESWGGFELKPNQSKEFQFNLSRLCKFDEIGIYKIIAKKNLYSSVMGKAFTAVSNPLDVPFVPREQSKRP